MNAANNRENDAANELNVGEVGNSGGRQVRIREDLPAGVGVRDAAVPSAQDNNRAIPESRPTQRANGNGAVNPVDAQMERANHNQGDDSQGEREGEANGGDEGQQQQQQQKDEPMVVPDVTLYDIIKGMGEGTNSKYHHKVSTSGGDVQTLVDHVTAATRVVRVLRRDVNLVGPMTEFSSLQIEAFEAWKRFDATRGAAFRRVGYAAERFNRLVAVGQSLMTEGRGSGMCRILFEGMRVFEYGLACVEWESRGQFWANFNVSQCLGPDPVTGVLGPVDFFDVQNAEDYLGDLVSAEYGDNTKFTAIFPSSFRRGRGYLWYLSVLLCQGMGRHVEWFDSLVLDIRPPAAGDVPEVTKYVLAWLQERATAHERALSKTVFYVTEGIQADVNSSWILDGDVHVAHRAAYQAVEECTVFPDRVVLTPEAVSAHTHAVGDGEYVVPHRPDLTAGAVAAAERNRDKAREEIARLEAWIVTTQNELLTMDGRAEKAAKTRRLRHAEGELEKARGVLADRETEAAVAGRWHGNIPDWPQTVVRGAATRVLPCDCVADYTLSILSPLGFYVRCGGRITPLTRGGNYLGETGRDVGLTMAYLLMDKVLCKLRVSFWETVENIRNYMAVGTIRASYFYSDHWRDVIQMYLIPAHSLGLSNDVRMGDSTTGGVVNVVRQPVPPDWVPGGRTEHWLPPWTVPNVSPIALVAEIFGEEELDGKVMTFPVTYAAVGVVVGVAVQQRRVGTVEDGMWTRHVPSAKQEYYSVSGGFGRPLHNAGWTGWGLAAAGITTTTVIPYGSMIDEYAVPAASQWMALANPQQLAGSTTWQPIESEQIPLLPAVSTI